MASIFGGLAPHQSFRKMDEMNEMDIFRVPDPRQYKQGSWVSAKAMRGSSLRYEKHRGVSRWYLVGGNCVPCQNNKIRVGIVTENYYCQKMTVACAAPVRLMLWGRHRNNSQVKS